MPLNVWRNFLGMYYTVGKSRRNSNILRTRFAPYYYYISVICCGILKRGSRVGSATVLENEAIMAFYGTWCQPLYAALRHAAVVLDLGTRCTLAQKFKKIFKKT